MKRIVTYIFFAALCSNIYAQKLSLTDLTNLCNKKNWEDVNQTLLTKGWVYYDSEKGSTYKYNTITWSFNKDYYNDKAQGWFYLYTYEGFPNKISYTVLNKESYSLIQNSISSAGFKLVNSEIEDNEVISTYGNTSYTLKISTEKRKDDDWSGRSLTAYNITLIKKAGIYDADNGKKIDYYYGDVVKAEYTLLNGKINGQIKTYHYNGKVKLIGNYTKGTKNGLFKEYDESGNLETEYSMSNGELNGALKTYYSNGKLKKSGNYLKGEEHGTFIEYDEYGNKEAEYVMASGELNGALKTYYSNGKLKKSSNYLKGEEHGNFVEYDEDGKKEAEYVMANGMKNGVLKIYVDGKIDVSTTFKDDIKNGQRIEYFYNDETGKLQFKVIGEYLNDEKNETWKLLFIEEDNKERLLTLKNYTKGVKNGQFQDIKGDSLIIGLYKNDELHGEYKVYLDLTRMLLGGVIRTDTAKLILIAQGSYYEGLESGYWKNYDLTGTLRSEGNYSNGNETGEWKYYYANWTDGKGNNQPYSKQLFLIQNYSNGRLDGKSTRYSYLEEEEYPCSEIDKNNPLDTCKRFVFQKVLETTFYKNGKLNGPFEVRDSINEIIVKGNFKDDLKDSEWLHRYSDKDINDETYFIYQKGNYTNDKREGKWIQYYTEGKIAKTLNYKNGELHGEYITWNQNNKHQSKKEFNNGNLIAIWNYEPSGNNITSSFLEIKIHNSIVSCIYSKITGDTIISQGYKYTTSLENENHNFFELDFFISTGDEKKIVKGPIVREKNVSASPTQKPSKTEFLKNPMQYMSKNGSDEVSKGWQFDGKYLISVASNVLEEGHYYNHYKNGLWTSYYYDQKIKIESNFTQDKRTDEKYLNLNGELFSGVFVYYDDENGIKEERKIKDGLRNGKTIYIDTKTKKTIKKESYKNGELK